MSEDWRTNAAISTVELCKGEGISRYNEEDVLFLLKTAANIERPRPEHRRVGYAYVLDQYSDTGLSKFLNLVESKWSSVPMPENYDHQYREAFPLACVFSLQLNKDSYQPETVASLLENYLKSSIPTPAVEITKSKKVFGSWYDFVFEYTKNENLSVLYSLLTRVDWVQDVVSKPLSEFGKRSIAMMR